MRALIEGGHSAPEISKFVRGKLRRKRVLVIDALASELAEHQRDMLATQLARVEADGPISPPATGAALRMGSAPVRHSNPRTQPSFLSQRAPPEFFAKSGIAFATVSKCLRPIKSLKNTI